MRGGLQEKTGVHAEHADGIDERTQSETGEKGSGDRARDAAEAVGGVHERHARRAVAMLCVNALGVHGNIHESHACTCKETACAELHGRLRQAAQNNGDHENYGAVFQNASTAPSSNESAAAEQCGKTGYAEAEQHQTYLGFVGAGLHFQRGQAGSEHAIGESGAEKEVRAGCAGDGKLSPFHAMILDFCRNNASRRLFFGRSSA